MKMFTTVIPVLFTLAAVTAILHISTSSLMPESGSEEETERIVWGEDAMPGQYPYAAALYNNGRFTCTCSILSNRTVMTAAHCVILNGFLQPASSFHAIANYSKSSPEVRIFFDRVTPHPRYQRSSVRNDIALFRTTEFIPFNEGNGVEPVCIARKSTSLFEYRNATAMGWGNTRPIRFPANIPDILQWSEQRIVNNVECGIHYGGIPIELSKICSTGLFKAPNYLNIWSGVCNGDSGGPLVHLSDDKCPVQIGIASYISGVAGCGKGVPAVFTRVSSFNDWILETSGDKSIISI